MRLEKDTLGEKYLTDETVYGINTQRAVENFPLSHKKVNLHLIHAMLLVKKAAAKTYENLVEDIEKEIKLLEKEIKKLAEELNFEEAIRKRDKMSQLKKLMLEL